ncbi:hypothetical protein TNCV_3765301 [Trichonephila clavipes]|nr:hypothetical protein TNCV_3765301 [Trichonephila clavipes]
MGFIFLFLRRILRKILNRNVSQDKALLFPLYIRTVETEPTEITKIRNEGEKIHMREKNENQSPRRVRRGESRGDQSSGPSQHYQAESPKRSVTVDTVPVSAALQQWSSNFFNSPRTFHDFLRKTTSQ